MRPLSLDLRQRIVDAYTRGEGSYATLAQRFHVGRNTVQRLVHRWQQTGSLLPHKPGGSTSVLSPDDQSLVVQWITDDPFLSQDELAHRFFQQTQRRVSRRTMGRLRARLNHTRKKK